VYARFPFVIPTDTWIGTGELRLPGQSKAWNRYAAMPLFHCSGVSSFKQVASTRSVGGGETASNTSVTTAVVVWSAIFPWVKT